MLFFFSGGREAHPHYNYTGPDVQECISEESNPETLAAKHFRGVRILGQAPFRLDFPTLNGRIYYKRSPMLILLYTDDPAFAHSLLLKTTDRRSSIILLLKVFLSSAPRFG